MRVRGKERTSKSCLGPDFHCCILGLVSVKKWHLWLGEGGKGDEVGGAPIGVDVADYLPAVLPQGEEVRGRGGLH